MFGESGVFSGFSSVFREKGGFLKMAEGENEGKTMVRNRFIAHINGKICIGGGNATSGSGGSRLLT